MNNINVKALEELTKEYNFIRRNNTGKTLKYNEVQDLVKCIPCSQGYINILVKNGLIEKGLTRGSYTFPIEPVYFSNIKKTLEELREKVRISNAKWLAKNNPKKSETDIRTLIKDFLAKNHISDEQLAEYLANTNNFKVIAKKVTWEEI